MLSQNPAVVNSIDLEGNLPIHLLATRAQAINEDEREKCSNCQDCFSFYLEANPTGSADLLTALQSLPDWLRDSAVLSPVVQRILNLKIAQRFPTAVTLLDFLFYIFVITFFQLAVTASLSERAQSANVGTYKLDPEWPTAAPTSPPAGTSGNTEEILSMNKGFLAPLYLAVFYFSMREIVQSFSLASLGLFNTWLADLENWFDMIYILLIFFWAIVMTVDGLDDYSFMCGAAISMGLFWFMILNFLQSIFVGFAVFVGGVTYVVKRLAAFLLALIIILICFAQIFFTLYRTTDQCPTGRVGYDYTDTYETECTPDEITGYSCQVSSCEPVNDDPFCSFRTSFFKVFTMLLGEVDESYFSGDPFATVLFCLFMFICVVVLANVLIAIVTDSYSVIQNERAGECNSWLPLC